MLIDYLGAEDTKYTREITRKTFAAAVARIYEPGCKFDYVLTLVGEEGLQKSTLVKKMGQRWFSDSIDKMVGKDAYEQLQGVWLVELAEMSAMNRSEVEAVKLFVAKQVDRYRVAYGRRTADFPRQCIFLASTNRDKPLKEAAGNRRFWAVDIHMQPPTKSIQTDLTDEMVRQLWGEAVYYYQAGEPLFLDKETELEARKIQRQHTEIDDRAGLVEQYLEMLLPDDWSEFDIYKRRAYISAYYNPDALEVVGSNPRKMVCSLEIFCEVFGGKMEQFSRKDSNDIRDIMAHINGWKMDKNSKSRFNCYGIQHAYRPVAVKEQKSL
jgi:predicted P-loop ATPase